jgi:hypothetical protein
MPIIPINRAQIVNGVVFAQGFFVSGSGSYIEDLSGSFTGSVEGTASYALNSDKLDGIDGNAFATTGSNLFRADQQISGSISMTGSLQTVRYIDFLRATGSAVPANTAGRVYYDLDQSALTVFSEIADTELIIGQEEHYLVKNQTGGTISKGELVTFAGTIGSSGRLLISRANQTLISSSIYVMGVAANTMNTGDDGFVIAFGKYVVFKQMEQIIHNLGAMVIYYIHTQQYRVDFQIFSHPKVNGN